MPVAEKSARKPWNLPGLRPTLNSTGFMFEVLDDYAGDFIRFAGETDGRVMDVGCAFGVATIKALEAGGRVIACDMAQGHLDELREKTPAGLRNRLECVTGQLPGIDFPDSCVDAILCSRVLHFLDGAAVDASIRKMYRWLRPGGRLYLVIDTPYGIWRKFIPVFEARRRRGDRWPGIMIGLENYLPVVPKDRPVDGPPFMNLMDPDLLRRTCMEAGFEIDHAGFIDRSDFSGMGRMDGRENAGILAIRPS